MTVRDHLTSNEVGFLIDQGSDEYYPVHYAAVEWKCAECGVSNVLEIRVDPCVGDMAHANCTECKARGVLVSCETEWLHRSIHRKSEQRWNTSQASEVHNLAPQTGEDREIGYVHNHNEPWPMDFHPALEEEE